MAISPCEFARQRYEGIARWRFLWTLLIFIFGATLLVLLIAILVLALIGQGVQAVLTAVGAVVNGVGVAFLVTRRNEAKAEEEAAYADVEKQCGPAQATETAKQVRAKLKIL